jgi:hypothetical protein
MRNYDTSFWYSFRAAVAWANIRARDTGKRQRVECVNGIDYMWPTRFVVVPAKAPVVDA